MDDVSLRRAPHPALRTYVDPYVGYRHRAPGPGRHRGMPSARLTVVLAFDEQLDLAWHGHEETRGRYWALASGLHSAPVDIRHDGLQHGIQLGLTPLGCRALLGVPAGELARALVPLDDLLPVPAHDELAGSTWEHRFEALDRLLLAAVAAHQPARLPHPELDRAWWIVERTAGTARVDDLADTVGWSRRRLGDRFRAEFGLTPKEASRVTRFDRSRRQVDAGVPLAEVAVASGYADQPHLNREWREIAGYSPREYLRAEHPFVQDPEPEDAAVFVP
jgi:AraC-like DNA-binding protein